MPRFGLRTLLLAMLILGCGLGWWFRPFTIARTWPSGERMSQFRVRRMWNGQLVTAGNQSWWWSNGQLARRGTSYGAPLHWSEVATRSRRFNSFTCIDMPLADEQTFRSDGRAVSPAQWPDWVAAHNIARRPAAVPTVYLAPSFPETPHEDGDRIYVIP